MLANNPDTTQEEFIDKVVNVAANIRELGTMRFLIADGGHLFNKFNELGDITIKDINNITEALNLENNT